MITLHSMEWSNWFSYGDDNKIDFDEAGVTQIIGSNGSGKSSIMLILQEILYGKNSAGIKKTNLRNRYTKGKLSGCVVFSKGDSKYTVSVQRTSSLRISLYCNGDEISSHTSAGTYKSLEGILGIDFKTFEQIVYQSSISSLQFLTATDTNRKNFLIGLLNLSEYLDLHEKFKKIHKEVSSQESRLSGEVAATKKWIESYNKDEEYKVAIDIPEIDDSIQNKVASLMSNEVTIDERNKRIEANNKLLEQFNELDVTGIELGEKPYDAKSEKDEMGKITFEVASHRSMLAKLKDLDDKCPNCLQDIDQELKNSMCADHEDSIQDLELRAATLEAYIKKASQSVKEWESHKKLLEKHAQLKERIDDSLLDEEIKNSQDLKDEIKILKEKIKNMEENHRKAIKYNSEVAAHNKQLDKNLEKFKEQIDFLKTAENKVDELINLKVKLEILKNSFSTKGLISYKIEYLIKDLEQLINKYLAELSDGRFQLFFTLNGDKLNVTINDNGNDVDISSLSMGERSRVNSATLLAIRSLMSDISDDKINLLFLDEILGTLDDYGKEKLIDLLLKEHSLNTFLVSHEYTHPLLDKIIVTKKDDISSISND